MATYETTIESTKSKKQAFSYMADFSNAEEWDPGVPSAEKLTDGPVRLGTTFRVEVSFLGRSTDYIYEVVEFDESDRVVLRAETPLLISNDTVTVEARGRQSTVTYQAVLSLKGPLRLFDPALRLAFGRIGDKAAAGLREALSAAASSAAKTSTKS